MKNKTKVYEIGNILHRKPNYDKLNELYIALKKELLDEPMQTSDMPLVTLENVRRSGNYEWQLYKVGNSDLVLELFGRWKGFAHEPFSPPYAEKADLYKMRLTIHNSKRKLEKNIEKMISNYPA